MVLLNAKQKTALLSLYSEEIKKRLAPLYYSSERPTALLELLSTREFDEKLLDSADEHEFGSKLWTALLNSPMKAALYDTILHHLSSVDPDLHSVLCCVSEEDSRSQFSKVLLYLEDFWAYLDVDAVLIFFKGIQFYSFMTSRIEKSLEGIEDDSVKKAVILRTLPLLGNEAIYDLMRAIYDHSEKSADFVNRLHPGFLRFYNLLVKERCHTRGVVSFCPTGVPVEDVMKTDLSTAQKYKVNLNYEDLPPALLRGEHLAGRLLKSIDERLFAETPIILREYQKELCEKALEGMNTIIAAPTGSGKTVVAVNIIKRHLEKALSGGKARKVLFMTPSTIILDQQAQCLRKFLGHRYEVLSVCGSDNVPLREIILAKDVVVTTPQCIVNLLNEGSISDRIEDSIRSTFDITTFTLIVFDECHNTVKNAPYSVLMRFYHRLRFSKRMKPDSTLPQIIGLTASLGVGGGSNEKDAITHVVKLCALLDCKVISTVRRNASELMQYSPIVCDEVCPCDDRSDQMRMQYLDTLCHLMRIFEEYLNAVYTTYATKPPAGANAVANIGTMDENPKYRAYNCFERAPEERTTQGYLNWVCNNLRRVVPETVFSEEAAKTRAIECLEILEDLYRAIEMYQDFSSEESFAYLKERMRPRLTSMTESSRQCWAEYSEKLRGCLTSDNTLISKLVEQLIANSNSDFRALVFIRTRRGASVLAKILNSHPVLSAAGLRVECVAGLSRGVCETTTKREQLEKLQRFREGRTRVLVATSVADEGLDVAKCNLVIKYNYATNEIAHVQRRGRGRSENSRSILITQNLKLIEQEEKNMLRERLVNRVLSAIQENRINLEARVNKAIEELMQDIQREDASISQRIAKQKESGIVYKLLCSKCDVLLCTSRDIKTYKDSQYCVCDPLFWTKICSEEISDDKAREEKYGAVAKLYCVSKNCKNILGRIVNIEQTLMPVLSATAFVLEHNETRKTVKKWINVKKEYFTPDPIRNYDLAAMSEAAGRPNFSLKGITYRFL